MTLVAIVTILVCMLFGTPSLLLFQFLIVFYTCYIVNLHWPMMQTEVTTECPPSVIIPCTKIQSMIGQLQPRIQLSDWSEFMTTMVQHIDLTSSKSIMKNLYPAALASP